MMFKRLGLDKSGPGVLPPRQQFAKAGIGGITTIASSIEACDVLVNILEHQAIILIGLGKNACFK